MQITNLALAYAVLEAKPFLENSIVKKIQELENGWLKIKLYSKQGSRDLILASQAFFFSSFSMPAKQQSSGFGAFLRKRLEGKKILGIKQHGFDRIVVLEFQDFFLVLELFAKGNIVLADSKMIILGALHFEEWKNRKIFRGETYKFPSSKGANPTTISQEEFEEIFKKSDLSMIHALISGLNIAPVIAEEALSSSGIQKEIPAKKISNAQLQALLEKIRDFYSVNLAQSSPVLAQKTGEQLILPFPLKEAETIKKFDSLNSAFEAFYNKSFLHETRKTEDIVMQKKLAELQKGLEMQLLSKEKFAEEIESNRQKAEAIYLHYSELQRAFALVRRAKEEKKTKEGVMYMLSDFAFIKDLDLKKSKLIAEF